MDTSVLYLRFRPPFLENRRATTKYLSVCHTVLSEVQIYSPLLFLEGKKPALAMLTYSNSVEQPRGGTILEREGQSAILQDRFRA